MCQIIASWFISQISSITMNTQVYIVHIENLVNQCENRKFYYFQVDGQQNVPLFHCHNVPEGLLTIVHSSWWLTTRTMQTCVVIILAYCQVLG